MMMQRLAAVAVVLLWLGAAPVAAQPELIGQWLSVGNLPLVPVHSLLLPNGKVMIWGSTTAGGVHLWDPETGAAVPLSAPGYNIFCAGHSFLADGRLLVTGGNPADGLGHASIYDPSSDVWTLLPDMNAGRFYPTVTTLPNGDALVIAGTAQTLGSNPLPQVWPMGGTTWRDLTSAVRRVVNYPWMYVAPNGQVFLAGPTPIASYLDPAGTGAWTSVAGSGSNRDSGSSVMYENGKVLIVGGGITPPTNTAQVIDLNASSPAWRSVAPMANARRHLNATLLPDGTVLVNGGTSGPGDNDLTGAVFVAERWDPATETWTSMASALIPRLYHSAALLLPDARVFATGGNGYVQAEVFEPPYLFKGPRPTISAAPSNVNYGEAFFVETPDAASIAQVTWVRLSAVTHAFNQNQRINRLSFVPGSGGLTVTTPATANLAPPGHYMLFLLNGDGVPSVAKIVHVASSSPSQPSLSIANATVTEGNTGTVNAEFTVSLSAASTQTVTVQYVTADDTATAGSDYQAAADTLTFSPGELTKSVTVTVNGDTLVEPTETFFVNLSNPTNATLAGGVGLGTITDDDSAPPTASITVLLPNGGQVWPTGGRRVIRWSSTGLTGSVKIELSRDGGTSWVVLFASTANDGAESWIVTGPATTQARIRITSSSGSASDVSDADFSITN